MSAVFHHAVVEGDVTKVRFLLKYSPGLRIDSTNNYGLTALQHAAQDGNVDMVNFLLERGADLSCVDQHGRTALHLASQEGHLAVVSLLVTSACANVNAKTERGEKAIDLAKTDQVRALLSQAMLTENFKRKCSLESDDLESSYYSSDGYRNMPGCRYSLSSTSTDSGVYDDSCSSQESNSDPKYNLRSNLGGSLRGYHSSAYSTISEDSGVSGLGANTRSRHVSRIDRPTPRARRVDGSPVTSILKSQSFSGNCNGEWNTGERSPQQDKIDEMNRYRRQEKSYVRDPRRRRTVTFGETEKVALEQERPSTSVTYHGSYTARKLPQVPPRTYTGRVSATSKEPPPIPPRIPLRNSARSSSLKDGRSPSSDNEVVFRPRPCPRIPRSEMGILQGNTRNRMSMFADISTKGMQ